MLSSACFRKSQAAPASFAVHALTGSQPCALCGGIESSTAAAVDRWQYSRGWSTTTVVGSRDSAGIRSRPKTIAPARDSCLWVSRTVNHHLGVSGHRYLSQDSCKLQKVAARASPSESSAAICASARSDRLQLSHFGVLCTAVGSMISRPRIASSHLIRLVCDDHTRTLSTSVLFNYIGVLHPIILRSVST